jgi:hypothetical protein
MDDEGAGCDLLRALQTHPTPWDPSAVKVTQTDATGDCNAASAGTKQLNAGDITRSVSCLMKYDMVGCAGDTECGAGWLHCAQPVTRGQGGLCTPGECSKPAQTQAHDLNERIVVGLRGHAVWPFKQLG